MSLSYDFYYLLRTQVELDNGFQSEPFGFLTADKPSLRQTGIPIDEDKRLFRSETFVESSQTGLPAQWLVQLKQGWAQVQGSYQEQFAKEGLSNDQANEFCAQALLGVALLIADAQLDSYTITMPLQGSRTADHVVFKPGQDLLGVVHQLPKDSDAARMPAPAMFARFESARRRKFVHWQLRLDAAKPHLAPMDMPTDTANPQVAANPVFAIYGLAHGELPEAEAWPQQLQAFLLGGDAAVLVRVLPRLLIRQWQFSRMDLAASLVRLYLRKQSTHFNQAPLSCLSSRDLSLGLQTLADLDADTRLLLGNLQQAITTIEIHQRNLTRRLQKADQHSAQWRVIWQRNQEMPLLDSFDADQQKLQSHITYIEGGLTSLEGIRRCWHFHFEGRQLVWTERLGSLGSILAFMVAVGVASITASTLSQSDRVTGNHSWLSPLVQWLDELLTQPWASDVIRLLSNPLVYISLVFVLVFPIGWHFGKAVVRKIRCCCRRWKPD
jgi:hypothetical protein